MSNGLEAHESTVMYHQEMREMQAKVYHTDGEVSTLKTQVSGIIEALNRIEQNQLNKPPLWNTGAVLSLIGVLAMLIVGVGQYVNLRMAPHEAEFNHFRDTQEAWNYDKDQFQRETHYEMGRAHTKFEGYDGILGTVVPQ